MPNLRELRSRIKSIESTSRVTKALQMIAAAKMKKAQDKVLEGRSYSEKLNAIISNVYQSNPEIFSLNSEDGSNKNLVLLVTPDRGLCGALVSNILKEASKFIDSIDVDYEIRVIGKKGTSFISKIVDKYESFKISDMPTFEEVSPITSNISNDIEENGFTKVFIIYTEFISTAVQKPKIKQLLPVEIDFNNEKVNNEFLYEPDIDKVSQALIPRYIETSIFNSILDSVASEHSARLVAMQNATENANELKQDLTLDLNKARQQQVTSEILDIVGGALALEE